MKLDDFGKLALQKYISTVEAYNAEAQKSKSIESKEEFTQVFLDTAEELNDFNDKIAKLKAALEDVLAKRMIAATPLIDPAYETAVKEAGINPEALKQQLATVRATAKYLSSMYGDEVLAETPKPVSLKTGASSGSGGRRIRGFDVYVDGVLAGIKNKAGEFKSTFSAAAKVLEVETTDLQRAFFNEAGMEDVKSDSFPSVVEFSFEDKSGEVHKIRAAKVDDSGDE